MSRLLFLLSPTYAHYSICAFPAWKVRGPGEERFEEEDPPADHKHPERHIRLTSVYSVHVHMYSRLHCAYVASVCGSDHGTYLCTWVICTPDISFRQGLLRCRNRAMVSVSTVGDMPSYMILLHKYPVRPVLFTARLH